MRGDEGVVGEAKLWSVEMAVGSPRIGCAIAWWGAFLRSVGDERFGVVEIDLSVCWGAQKYLSAFGQQTRRAKMRGNEEAAGDLKVWSVKIGIGSARIGCAS